MKTKLYQRIILIVLLIAFAVGIFLTVYSSVMMISDSSYKKSTEYTEAVVSHREENGKGGYDYIVAFNAEGQHFEEVYKKANSKTYIGETLSMYYEPGNPDNHRIISDGGYKYLLALGIIVTAFSLVIGAMVLTPVIVRNRLIKNGKWQMCKVIKIKKDGRAHRLYCDSTKLRGKNAKPFVSDAVRGQMPKNLKDTAVAVYYSEKHPGIYYVDTRNL